MITPTSQVLRRAVGTFVAKGSGLARKAVIPGNVSAPVPDKDVYATVTMETDLPEGLAWVRDEKVDHRAYDDPAVVDGPTIDETAYRSSEITWSVQWFRDGADDAARRFAVWATSPAGVSEAARLGLTVYRTDPIRNLDDVDPMEAYEQRRQIDLVIGIVSADVRDVGIIDSARIDIFPERLAGETPPGDRISTEVPTDKQEAQGHA